MRHTWFMHPDQALEISSLIASKFKFVVDRVSPSDINEPLTLTAILRVGFLLAKVMRQAFPDVQGGFEISEQFMAAMFAQTADPEALQKFFNAALLKSDEDPLDLRASLDEVTSDSIRLDARADLMAAFETVFPPLSVGAPRKITRSDFPALVERSERLRPIFWELLKLQEDYPQYHPLQCLAFLQPKYPAEFIYIEKRLPKLQQALENSQALARAKTNRAKSRIMADLMAASDYGLAPISALQKAEEARRMVRGKQRASAPRLPEL